ncbi:MAG: hypothetical protein ACOYXR_09230 [Nitrospirota bacterium]
MTACLVCQVVRAARPEQLELLVRWQDRKLDQMANRLVAAEAHLLQRVSRLELALADANRRLESVTAERDAARKGQKPQRRSA